MALTARDVTNKIRDDITARILDALAKGVKPWQRPWAGGRVRNVVSKRPYQGVNVLLLALHQMQHDLHSNVYGTFNQWMEKKSPVKKGAKGCQIIYFSPVVKKTTNEEGEEEKKSYGLLKTYTVFAADQTQEGNKFMDFVLAPVEPFDEVERLVAASGARIKHGGDRAFYSLGGDFIQLPPVNTFRDANSYHGTQLHELTHWTGHKDRCNRVMTGNKFADSYAFEELVAEIGGCFLMGHCGLEMGDLENHVSYVSSWLSGIKGDNNAIFRAASMASKASDYILNLAGVNVEPATEAITA